MPIGDLQPTQPYDKPDNEGGIQSYNPKQSQEFLERREKQRKPKKTFADLKQDDYKDIPIYDEANVYKSVDGKDYDIEGNVFDANNKSFSGLDPVVKAKLVTQEMFNQIVVTPEIEKIDEGLKNLYQTGALSFGEVQGSDVFNTAMQMETVKNRITKTAEEIGKYANMRGLTFNQAQDELRSISETETLKNKSDLPELTKLKGNVQKDLTSKTLEFMGKLFNPLNTDDTTELKKEIDALAEQRKNLSGFIKSFSQAQEFITYGEFLKERTVPELFVHGIHSILPTISAQFKGAALLQHYTQQPETEKIFNKIASTIDNLAKTFDTEPKRETWLDSLAEGMGSTFGFMATNIVASYLTEGSSTMGTFATAVSGALANGSDAYYETLNKGGTEKEAVLMFLFNGLAGTSEALGVEGIMKTLDRVGGDGFMSFFKEATKKMLVSGLEEGSQETFQTAFGNLTEYLIYNDKVDLFSNLTSSFGTSFGVGFLMGGLHSYGIKSAEKVGNIINNAKYKSNLDKLKLETDNYRQTVLNTFREQLNRNLSPEETKLMDAYVNQVTTEINDNQLQNAEVSEVLEKLPEGNLDKHFIAAKMSEPVQASIDVLKHKETELELYTAIREITKSDAGLKGTLDNTNTNLTEDVPQHSFQTNNYAKTVNSDGSINTSTMAAFQPGSGKIIYDINNLAKGYQLFKKRGMQLSPREFIQYVSTHEAIHALTAHKIEAYLTLQAKGRGFNTELSVQDIEDLSKLDTLFNIAQTVLGKDLNGTTDLHEFVADLKSSETFRNKLAGIPVVNQESGFKNLLEQVKFYLYNIANRIFKFNEGNINRFKMDDKTLNLLQVAESVSDSLISRFNQNEFNRNVIAFNQFETKKARFEQFKKYADGNFNNSNKSNYRDSINLNINFEPDRLTYSGELSEKILNEFKESNPNYIFVMPSDLSGNKIENLSNVFTIPIKKSKQMYYLERMHREEFYNMVADKVTQLKNLKAEGKQIIIPTDAFGVFNFSDKLSSNLLDIVEAGLNELQGTVKEQVATEKEKITSDEFNKLRDNLRFQYLKDELTGTEKLYIQGKIRQRSNGYFYIETDGGYHFNIGSNALSSINAARDVGSQVTLQLIPKSEWNANDEFKRADGTAYGDKIAVLKDGKQVATIRETDYVTQSNDLQSKGKELQKELTQTINRNKEIIAERQVVNVQNEYNPTVDINNIPDNLDAGRSLGNFVNSVRNTDGTQVFRSNSDLLNFGKQFLQLGDVQGLAEFEKGLATRLGTTVVGLYEKFYDASVRLNNNRSYTEDLFAKIKASTKKNVVIINKVGFEYTVNQVTTDSYKNADGIFTSTINRRALYEDLQAEIKQKSGLNLKFVEIGYFQIDNGAKKFSRFGQTGFKEEDYTRSLLRAGFLVIPSENEHIAIDLYNSTDSKNRQLNVGKLLRACETMWDIPVKFKDTIVFDRALDYIKQNAPEYFEQSVAKYYRLAVKRDEVNLSYALFKDKTVGDLLNNNFTFNSGDKQERQVVAITRANVYLDIVYTYLFKELYANQVFPSLKDNQAAQFKRLNNVGGESSIAFISQYIYKQLQNNEPSKNAVWMENGKVLSRDVILDTTTVPQAIKDYFNNIKMGDGSVIVSQEIQNITNDLNGVPIDKRGYASKTKQVGIDRLDKNAWHIAPPYTPLNTYLYYNKIGKIFMDTAIKVDTRDIVKISWEDLLNNKTPNEKQVAINDLTKDSYIKSTGIKHDTAGGLSSAMIRTGFLGLINDADKQAFLSNSTRLINNLSNYINDVSTNPEKYIKELVQFAKANSFDSSTRRFILQNFDINNNPNPLLGLAHLYSVVDYFLAGRLPEKFFDAMTLRQQGVYPTLMPDLGNATGWKNYLIGNKQMTEDEANQYFVKINNEYYLKNGYLIASADTGLKRNDKVMAVVIPPAGIQDMRAMTVIGVVYNQSITTELNDKPQKINKNMVVVPNDQFVGKSGKDFDIDQVALLSIGNNDILGKMWDIINKFDGDAKMQSYLNEFIGKENPVKEDDVIIDDTYWKKRQAYWKTQIQDVKIDLPFAKMLDLFGKNPDFTAINFSNPIFLQTAFKKLKSDIGLIFNLGVFHTAMLEKGSFELTLANGAKATVSLKGKLSDQLSVLYELTHYSLDWQSDPKILALNFSPQQFYSLFFDIKSEDIHINDIKNTNIDVVELVEEIRKTYLMPLRNTLRQVKGDENKVGLQAVKKVISDAKISLANGNPFAETFIGQVADKISNLGFGTLMPSASVIEKIKNQIKSAIRSGEYNLTFDKSSSVNVKRFANIFNRLVNAPSQRGNVRFIKALEPLVTHHDIQNDKYITSIPGLVLRTEKNLRDAGFFETIDNLHQLREFQQFVRDKFGSTTTLSHVFTDYIVGLLTSGTTAVKNGRIGFMNGKGFNHLTNKVSKDEQLNGALFIVDSNNGVITYERKSYVNGVLVSQSDPFYSFREFVAKNSAMYNIIENEKEYGFTSRLFNTFNVADYYGELKTKLGSDAAASKYIKEMTDKNVNGQGLLTFKNDKGRNYTDNYTKNLFKEFVNSELFTTEPNENQNLFFALITGAYDESLKGIINKTGSPRSLFNFSMAIEGSSLKSVNQTVVDSQGQTYEKSIKATDFSSPLTLIADTDSNAAREFLDKNLPKINQVVKDNIKINDTTVADISDLPNLNNLSDHAKQLNLNDPTIQAYRKIVEDNFTQLESISDMSKDEWIDMITQDILDYTDRKSAEVAIGKIPKSKGKSFKQVAEELARVSLKDIDRNNLIFPKIVYGKGLIKQRMLQYFGNRNILMTPQERIKYKLGGQERELDLMELMQSFDIFNPIDKPANVSGSWIAWQILSTYHDYYADKSAEIENLQKEIFGILEGTNIAGVETKTGISNFSGVIGSQKVQNQIWKVAEGSDKNRMLKSFHIARMKILQESKGTLWAVEEKDSDDYMEYLSGNNNVYYRMRRIKKSNTGDTQGIYEYDNSENPSNPSIREYTKQEYETLIADKLKNGVFKYTDKTSHIALWKNKAGKTKLYQIDEQHIFVKSNKKKDSKRPLSSKNMFGTTKKVLFYLTNELLEESNLLKANTEFQSKALNNLLYRKMMTAISMRWAMDAVYPEMLLNNIADLDNMGHEAALIKDIDLQTETMTLIINTRLKYSEQLRQIGQINNERIQFGLNNDRHRFIMPKYYNSIEHYETALQELAQKYGAKNPIGQSAETVLSKLQKDKKRNRAFFEEKFNEETVTGAKYLPLHQNQNYTKAIYNIGHYLEGQNARIRSDAMRIRTLMNERYLEKENSFIKHEMRFMNSLTLGEDFLWKPVDTNKQRLKVNNGISFLLKKGASYELIGKTENKTVLNDQEEQILFGSITKVEPFYYTVKLIGEDVQRRFDIKQISQVRTTKGLSIIKKTEVLVNQLFGSSKNIDNIAATVDAAMKLKIKATTYALLNFKPFYSYRNKLGGNLMNRSLFTGHQLQEANKLIEQFGKFRENPENVANETKREYFEMLSSEVSAIFGSLNELMGKFGNVIKTSEDLLSPDFVKLAMTSELEWKNVKQSTERELDFILKQIDNKKGINETNLDVTKLQKIGLSLQKFYAKNALYNFPMGLLSKAGSITESSALGRWANPQVTEEENRNATVFATALACLDIFEVNNTNIDPSTQEGFINLEIYKKIVKRFIAAQTQQNIRNSQFMYRQAFDLSHWDSTLMGRAMITQFGHYQNSLESAYANKMRNMFRMADEFGWINALSFKDQHYNAIYRDPETGEELILKFPAFSYSRQFAKMTTYCLFTTLLNRGTQSLKYLQRAAGLEVMQGKMWDLFNLFFVSNLNEALTIRFIDGVVNGLLLSVGALFLNFKDPDDIDDKSKRNLRKSWQNLFGWSEKDYAKFKKDILEHKYGKEITSVVTKQDYKIDYYRNLMTEIGIPLMMFIPAGVGANQVLDAGSKQLAYSLFKSSYEEAFVPDGLVMQTGMNLAQTIVPFGYLLTHYGRNAYLQFLARNPIEQKIFKKKSKKK